MYCSWNSSPVEKIPPTSKPYVTSLTPKPHENLSTPSPLSNSWGGISLSPRKKSKFFASLQSVFCPHPRIVFYFWSHYNIRVPFLTTFKTWFDSLISVCKPFWPPARVFLLVTGFWRMPATGFRVAFAKGHESIFSRLPGGMLTARIRDYAQEVFRGTRNGEME